MKKKILKILAFVLALCLLGVVCLFANVMVGNPVSKALAKRSSQDYLIENHAGEGYEIKKVAYDWYNTEYLVECAVPGSLDRHFRVDTDFFGNISNSTYENDVLQHWNTRQRLDHSYFELCDAALNSLSFSFDLHLSLFRFVFASDGEARDKPSYALRTEDLQTDYNYDIRRLAAESGLLTIHCRDEEVTVARLCEILLEVKNAADAAGIPFYVLTCSLENPRPSDGEEYNYEQITVYSFLRSDIYEDGLENRVRLAIEKQK